MGNLSVAMFDYRRARPNTDKYIRLSENRNPKSTVSPALCVWRYTLHFQTNPSIVLLVNIPAVGTPHEFKLNHHFQTHPYWYIVVIYPINLPSRLVLYLILMVKPRTTVWCSQPMTYSKQRYGYTGFISRLIEIITVLQLQLQKSI